MNLIFDKEDVDELTANTITMLFFTHSVVKIVYFAARSKLFYRTLAIWNNPNSHPLFAESNARFHGIAVTKMRRLLFCVGAATMLSVFAWTGITFVGPSIKRIHNTETNSTDEIEVKKYNKQLFTFIKFRFLFTFFKSLSLHYFPNHFVYIFDCLFRNFVDIFLF